MKLYLVPTPIGNLKDITLRSLEVLKEVDYIICEDTRRTKILLDHYGIKDKKLISYFAPKEEEKIPYILKILENENCALVVDSGMPGISDPGYRLIKACLEKNIKVEALPGPSAFLTVLVASGLPLDKFLFLGFLPKKGLENYFKKIKDLKMTIVFYESSKRILKTIKTIKNVWKQGKIVLGREISKIHEEYIRSDLGELINKLEVDGNKNENLNLKGEITVIFRENEN